MIFVFAGVAVALMLVGATVSFYQNRRVKNEYELPKLSHKYRKRATLEQRVFEWAEQRDAALNRWLLSLAPKPLSVVVRGAEKFCEQKQFKLGWVLERQIEDAALLDMLDNALLQHLNAQRIMKSAEKELESYVTLVSLLQNSRQSRRKREVELVYRELVKNGTLPQENIDLLLTRDRNRWQKVAQSITIASRANRPAVNRAVREHVLGDPPRPEPTSMVTAVTRQN